MVGDESDHQFTDPLRLIFHGKMAAFPKHLKVRAWNDRVQFARPVHDLPGVNRSPENLHRDLPEFREPIRDLGGMLVVVVGNLML